MVLFRSGLILVIVALAGFTSLSPTSAQEPEIALGIAPVDYTGQHFDVTMEPGESRELRVQVSNHGTADVGVRTYAADVYTIIGGGFGARLDGEATSGTTHWLLYPSTTINLPADQGLNRSFSITVPDDAKPGEYITSLVVQNAVPTEARGGDVAIRQVKRTALAVVITVPGLREPSLTIDGFEHSYLATTSVIAAHLTNTGNVRLKPFGELTVTQADGQLVSRFPVTMDSVYAGTEVTLEVPFAQALMPGDYLVGLSLEYEDGSVEGTDAALTVPEPAEAGTDGVATGAGQTAQVNQQQPGVPQPTSASTWWLLLGAVGAISGLYAAVRLVRRNRHGREPREGAENASHSGPELREPIAVFDESAAAVRSMAFGPMDESVSEPPSPILRRPERILD